MNIDPIRVHTKKHTKNTYTEIYLAVLLYTFEKHFGLPELRGFPTTELRVIPLGCGVC